MIRIDGIIPCIIKHLIARALGYFHRVALMARMWSCDGEWVGGGP